MNSQSPLDDLFYSMTAGGVNGQKAMGTLAVLLTETLRYRDRLKEESGYVLTVQDTREALDALERHLNGRSLPSDLTFEQTGLAQILIHRLTAFS